MKSLGDGLHRQVCFGARAFGFGFAAGEDSKVAEGAEYEVDDVTGAALIVAIGDGEETAEFEVYCL